MTHGDRERSGEDPSTENESSARARRRPRARAALGLALLLVIPLAGQVPLEQFPSQTDGRIRQIPDSSGPYDQNPNPPNQKRMQILNAERQKALVSDTEKLLKLARELNDDVAVSDSGRMNEEQLHKVSEIGKLAKSIKEKMTYSLGGYPGLNPPLTIPPGDR